MRSTRHDARAQDADCRLAQGHNAAEEDRWRAEAGTYVFPDQGDDNAFGSFPNHWEKMFRNTQLADITPHVLRHSFASITNNLGFTDVTIVVLVGHAKASVTSKYIHALDTALIMAADTISGYVWRTRAFWWNAG